VAPSSTVTWTETADVVVLEVVLGVFVVLVVLGAVEVVAVGTTELVKDNCTELDQRITSK
jgi:hypothetical protein